jgi:hypothetical protein
MKIPPPVANPIDREVLTFLAFTQPVKAWYLEKAVTVSEQPGGSYTIEQIREAGRQLEA